MARSQGEQEDAPHSASVVCERDCWIRFDFSGGEAAAPEMPSDIEAAPAADKAKQQTGSLDQFDLLAQERMAHWAILVAILTGLGVLLLYETLRETANATEAAATASKAAMAQAVANVRIISDPILWLDPSENGQIDSASLHFRFDNKGDTPANDCRVEAAITISRQAKQIERFELKPLDGLPASFDIEPREKSNTIKLRDDRFRLGDFDWRDDPKVVLHCLVTLNYRDAFGDSIPRTFNFEGQLVVDGARAVTFRRT